MSDAEVAGAVHQLVVTWDGYTCADLGPALTCGEFEALEDVLIAAGSSYLAECLRKGHSDGDDCGDEHCVCGRPECDSYRVDLTKH